MKHLRKRQNLHSEDKASILTINRASIYLNCRGEIKISPFSCKFDRRKFWNHRLDF